jgi:WD40 repeat protein
VHGVAFSPDSRRILSGDADGTMRLWDLHTKKPLRRFEGHGPMVNSVSFTAAGRQALSGGLDLGVISPDPVRDDGRDGPGDHGRNGPVLQWLIPTTSTEASTGVRSVFALSRSRTGYMSGETGVGNSTITALLQGSRAMTRRIRDLRPVLPHSASAFSAGQRPRGAAAPPGCRQTPDWRTGDP